MSLAMEKTVPTNKGDKKLDIREAEDLLKTLNEWVIEGAELIRRFNFKDFSGALDFVNKIGKIAEEAGHHPDIFFGWGYAEVRLTTHDANGITRNDFIVAAKIDKLHG